MTTNSKESGTTMIGSHAFVAQPGAKGSLTEMPKRMLSVHGTSRSVCLPLLPPLYVPFLSLNIA